MIPMDRELGTLLYNFMKHYGALVCQLFNHHDTVHNKLQRVMRSFWIVSHLDKIWMRYFHGFGLDFNDGVGHGQYLFLTVLVLDLQIKTV